MLELEPYRVLFPAGLLSAAIGLSLWPLFSLQWLEFYPREQHAHLMVFGFLMAFASGFLMTAIPRMSGTSPSSRGETGFVLLLIAAQISALFVASNASFYVAAAQFAFLFLFVGRRRTKHKGSAPAFFIFLPLGLALGLIGCLVRILPIAEAGLALELSRIFLYKGFLMCLVVGVGMRLLPVFLANAPTPLEASPSGHDPSPIGARISALVYILALIVELHFSRLGNLLQLGVMVALFFTRLKIISPPLRRGVQAWGVWISLWSLLAGQFWLVAWPNSAIHGVHLIYIGGWALMVFMVATRVILSHGGFSLAAELNSKALALAIFFWICSALTRVSMAFLPAGIFWAHASYSVACWLLGTAFWIGAIGWKIFRVERGTTDEECN